MTLLRIRTSCLCVVVATGACAPHGSLGFWAEDVASGASDAGATMSVGGSNNAGAMAVISPALPATTLDQQACGRQPPAFCELEQNVVLPLELTADPFGMQRFFGDGAELPTGDYQIEYIGGCVKYGDVIDPTASIAGYTVHAGTDPAGSGLASFWLIAGDGTLLTMTPGTRGILTGEGVEPFGAFQSFASCVEANCKLPAEDFAFAGGKLGIYQNPTLNETQATPPTPTEDAPRFRLSRKDCKAKP